MVRSAALSLLQRTLPAVAIGAMPTLVLEVNLVIGTPVPMLRLLVAGPTMLLLLLLLRTVGAELQLVLVGKVCSYRFERLRGLSTDLPAPLYCLDMQSG